MTRRIFAIIIVVVAIITTAVLLLLFQNKETTVIDSAYPYSFIFFGDAGESTEGWTNITESIVEIVNNEEIDALFMLGDNIYDEGASSISDPLFATLYEKPFASILDDVQINVVPGNHDIITDNGQAELDYAKAHEYWYQPDRNYARSYGPIRVVGMDSNESAISSEQLQFVQDALASDPNTKISIVLAHHPVYSSGLHGQNNDQPWMKKDVEPVLEAGGVDFFLAGHDHTFEAFGPKKEVNHIVCGAATRPRPIPEDHASLRLIEGNSFCRLDFFETYAMLTVYDEYGDVLWNHQYSLD